MHGQINNLVGVSVFPLRGASWTVLPTYLSLFAIGISWCAQKRSVLKFIPGKKYKSIRCFVSGELSKSTKTLSHHINMITSTVLVTNDML